MKIIVDDEVILELTDIQKKVIMNDISSDMFDEDMKRRLVYILMHKYERCYARLCDEWCKDYGDGCKLMENGVDAIPTNPEKVADLIFSQPNYKDRKAQDEEMKNG